MSDTDSFIDEVNEEVRKDRFYGYLKKYGWIAALILVAIVGGAGVLEYRKAQDRARAEALGDALLEALAEQAPEARQNALSGISAETPEGAAILQFLQAGAASEAEDTEAAVAALDAIAGAPDLPLVYRQFATFRSLLLQSDTLDADARRAGFETLSAAGVPFRVLAEEQIALIEVETGQPDAAITRFRSLLNDAEASAGLQQRAIQAIVALGGTLEDISGADDASSAAAENDE